MIALQLQQLEIRQRSKILSVPDLRLREPGTSVLFTPAPARLLNTIIGMRSPISGSVLLFEESVHTSSEEKKRVQRTRCGIVTQRVSLISNLSIRDNISLPLRYHDDTGDVDAAVQGLLETWGLLRVADNRPWQVPLSAQRLAAIVRATSTTPDILLLEDPVEDVTPAERHRIITLIDQTAKRIPVLIAMWGSLEKAERRYGTLSPRLYRT